jgi:phytoene dehydrogenase-like protein
MVYDVIVVGGGISGLTATAYIAREGKNVLLIEQGDKVGGLVSSFPYKGFMFDGGIRAIENSGIVMPMLKQLGIEVEFLKSTVTLGIEDEIVYVKGEQAVEDYRDLLVKKFPDNQEDIYKITSEIKRIMKYLDILYGINNPLFLDIKTDWKYFITDIIPWMFKYAFTFKKVEKLNTPVEDFLRTLTSNQALNDVIAQHFFKHTPTFFALSYFSLYLDYQYPKGGTGSLIKAIEKFILDHNGVIQCDTKIVKIDPTNKTIYDQNGNHYQYKQLIWSSNNVSLYNNIDQSAISDALLKEKLNTKIDDLKTMRGGDSILTTYATVDLPKSYFQEKCSAHFFYTPKLDGLYDVFKKESDTLEKGQKEITDWVDEYLEKTTYEISIPSLRDSSLAPEGKTGLIISTLFSYDISKKIRDNGWYEDFKKQFQSKMIQVLHDTVYPGLKDKVMDTFGSSPLTIESRTSNLDGAITGWAFTNPTIPAESKLIKVAKSVDTILPDIYQSGQWSYSPAGLPVSIMTGKLASDRVLKNMKKIK